MSATMARGRTDAAFTIRVIWAVAVDGRGIRWIAEEIIVAGAIPRVNAGCGRAELGSKHAWVFRNGELALAIDWSGSTVDGAWALEGRATTKVGAWW